MAIGYGEHDARHFAVSIFGILMDGFGEDAMVSIEPNSDHRVHKVSADGHVVSAKISDKSAIATLTLMETSSSHRALLAMYALDDATPGGAAVGGFEMKDLVNGDVDSSERCWIMRRPNRVASKEIPEYEWKFILGRWESSF